MMGAIWKSRGFRKFRKSKLAVGSALVILSYIVLAIAVLCGAISSDDIQSRVGARNVNGFGVQQKPEKRWDDAEFYVAEVNRALTTPGPEAALKEIRYGRIVVADRSVAELQGIVADANARMDRLANEAEDINEQPEFWGQLDELDAVIAKLFRAPTGWDGFVQTMSLSCGTDRQGRSILARGLYSAMIAVAIGIVVAVVSVVIGGLLGAAAAFYGGWVDYVVIWLYSSLSSIPSLVLLGVIVFMFAGSSSENTLLPVYAALCLTFWVGPCRVVRGETLRLKELDYIQAATAIGQSRFMILLKHVVPNVSYLLFINFSLLFVAAVKSEVILTFLGLGVKDGASWGLMISAAKPEVVNAFFWQIGTATALMFVLVLAFNLFTDALQDALDPKHIA